MNDFGAQSLTARKISSPDKSCDSYLEFCWNFITFRIMGLESIYDDMIYKDFERCGTLELMNDSKMNEFNCQKSSHNSKQTHLLKNLFKDSYLEVENIPNNDLDTYVNNKCNHDKKCDDIIPLKIHVNNSGSKDDQGHYCELSSAPAIWHVHPIGKASHPSREDVIEFIRLESNIHVLFTVKMIWVFTKSEKPFENHQDERIDEIVKESYCKNLKKKARKADDNYFFKRCSEWIHELCNDINNEFPFIKFGISIYFIG